MSTSSSGLNVVLVDFVKYGAPLYGILSVLALFLPGLHLPASVAAEVSGIVAALGAALQWAQSQGVSAKIASKFGYTKNP